MRRHLFVMSCQQSLEEYEFVPSWSLDGLVVPYLKSFDWDGFSSLFQANMEHTEGDIREGTSRIRGQTRGCRESSSQL